MVDFVAQRRWIINFNLQKILKSQCNLFFSRCLVYTFNALLVYTLCFRFTFEHSHITNCQSWCLYWNIILIYIWIKTTRRPRFYESKSNRISWRIFVWYFMTIQIRLADNITQPVSWFLCMATEFASTFLLTIDFKFSAFATTINLSQNSCASI